MRRLWRWIQWRILGTRCKCGGEFSRKFTMFGHYDICIDCGASYYETDN